MAAAYRRLSKNRYLKILFILFFCTYFFCLILLTSTRCQVWRNSDSLWKDTLLKNPKAFLAYHNRGTQLLSSIDNLNKGKSKEQSDRARPGPDLVKEIPLIIEAMENFNEAIKINPRFAKSYYNRGILFNKLGLTKSALREYSIAIELNPKFVESYINRGVLYYSMGEHDKATSDYSKVLQLVPSHPKALKYRAAAYLALRDYDLALSDLESALSINPQDEEVRTKRDLVNYYKAHYNQG